MAIVPYNQKNNVIPRPIGNMLDDFFGDSWHIYNNLKYNSFKLDVREEILHYTVEAELPGIPKEDIDINFKDGILTICVAPKEMPLENESNYIHRERNIATMQRSVYLDGAKDSGITAALANGLLRITIPKDDTSKKSSKIEIQ